jgi:hypothetical protein
MNEAERIEVAAAAMWRHRASNVHLTDWGRMTWANFNARKPDIAEIYRENARVAVEALDSVTTAVV